MPALPSVHPAATPTSAPIDTPGLWLLSPALVRVEAPAPTHPLHTTAAARALEQAALALHPPHALMAQAGLALARLALALAPHARHIWVACGPGNNGGDGLVAAAWLQRWGKSVEVSLLGEPTRLPADAAQAWATARDAGVPMHTQPQPQRTPDLAIDALLGLGQSRPPSGPLRAAVQALHQTRQDFGTQVLAADVPTGLNADTGQLLGEPCVQADATLALLSLKPGLYTGQGRDWAGALWWAPLLLPQHPAWQAAAPSAHLIGADDVRALLPARQHGQHKGTFGDVWVIGGAAGMTGAALLAGRAALHAGAGRVYVSPPEEAVPASTDPHQPELMHRPTSAWLTGSVLAHATVVCGCGGGSAVAQALPHVLNQSARMVLDADALNAIATAPALLEALRQRAPRGQATLLTPHPLEAARLLGCTAAQVQHDRLRAAQQLAEHTQAGVVLKGSGTVVAEAPLGRAPDAPTHAALWLNPTGNARLGTPGSGDVLAGWLGGLWSAQAHADTPVHVQARRAACAAVWLHGHAATPESAAPNLLRLPLPAHALIDALSSASARL